MGRRGEGGSCEGGSSAVLVDGLDGSSICV